MKIFFDSECCQELQDLLHNPVFQIASTPEDAEVIIFQNHFFNDIIKSELFQNHKEKCIILSQTYRPSFFLPGIYTNNFVHPLSNQRAKTYCYFYYDPRQKNKHIKRYKNANEEISKKFLFSFMGGATAPVRKRIFKLYEGITENRCVINTTSQYDHWNVSQGITPSKAQKQEAYALNVKESLFYLCPRGAGHASIRMYEVMELGVAPVIISDGWIPPEGPDWESFSIFLKEKDVSEIESILEKYRSKASEMGANARKAFDTYFADEKHPYEVYRLIKEVIENRNFSKEKLIFTIFPLYDIYMNQKAALKNKIKKYLKT